MKKRLVQIQRGEVRRVALVEEPELRLLRTFGSVYALAAAAIGNGGGISDLIEADMGDEVVRYDEVYRGESAWRLMVPVDHVGDVSRLLVSGTGLTHWGARGIGMQCMRERRVGERSI